VDPTLSARISAASAPPAVSISASAIVARTMRMIASLSCSDVDASGIPRMLEFSSGTLPVFALPTRPGPWFHPWDQLGQNPNPLLGLPCLGRQAQRGLTPIQAVTSCRTWEAKQMPAMETAAPSLGLRLLPCILDRLGCFSLRSAPTIKP